MQRNDLCACSFEILAPLAIAFAVSNLPRAVTLSSRTTRYAGQTLTQAPHIAHSSAVFRSSERVFGLSRLFAKSYAYFITLDVSGEKTTIVFRTGRISPGLKKVLAT